MDPVEEWEGGRDGIEAIREEDEEDDDEEEVVGDRRDEWGRLV